MKKIVTLLAATVATLGMNAQAQITINQSDFTAWTPRTDTFQDLDTDVALAANGSWDLTSKTYDPDAYTFGYSAFTNTTLPTATYSYLSYYGFSALGYLVDIAGRISANGVEEVGEKLDAAAYDISQLTTRAGDSLIFPAQTIVYSAPRTRISFPLTFGKTWTSSFNRTTNIVLKYNGGTYPGGRTSFTTQVDSVKGWGRVRIKRLDGTSSGWIDVLGVKTKTLTIDTFSMTPPQVLPALLAGFGLRQGMRDSTHSMQLYRKGEVEPMLLVFYEDTTYTSVEFATVHQSRIPSNVGVKNIAGAAGIKLFPNPAKAASGFDIDLIETAAGTWSYNLLDASGRIVSSSVITPNGTKAHINAGQAAPGNYFLNIQNNGQQVATAPVVISE